MKDATRRWFDFAEIDLRTARLTSAEGIYSQACFHAH